MRSTLIKHTSFTAVALCFLILPHCLCVLNNLFTLLCNALGNKSPPFYMEGLFIGCTIWHPYNIILIYLHSCLSAWLQQWHMNVTSVVGWLCSVIFTADWSWSGNVHYLMNIMLQRGEREPESLQSSVRGWPEYTDTHTHTHTLSVWCCSLAYG